MIRTFKKVPHDERLGKIGGVIKAFQAEVDALTRRQAFAEDAFLSLYRSLDDAPDPTLALRAAETELSKTSACAAENEKLKEAKLERFIDYQSPRFSFYRGKHQGIRHRIPTANF